jgi:DNA adenine methylase
MPRSFLRWVGSKRGHLEKLIPALPETFNTYWEPFLGSGALFFLLMPSRAVLGDSCSPLMKTFSAVRDGPKKIVELYENYSVMDSDAYYEVRSEDEPKNRFEKAARFIYLNRACWNGLYRVNRKGHFNVPYGRPKSDSPIDRENLIACSQLLRTPGVRLVEGDFQAALVGAHKGDLVFLDPPYVTQHNNNGFVDYNQRLFSWEDQIRMAKLAETLRSRGVHVIVTNANHQGVAELYPKFSTIQFERTSSLAADKLKRGIVSEAIFFSEK